MRFLMILFLAGMLVQGNAQCDRWQQRVEYDMEIDMDVESYRFDGKQALTYFNNSPDTLDRVFYHLYFNAFQPGSMMDVRSRTIIDPDPRVGDRISKLTESEIGYIKVLALTQDGDDLRHHTEGTVLEVELEKPLLPGEKTLLEMDFVGQVPVQIRRSGRNNKEGISLSMSQWYPKLAEYDYQGWHAHPYVGREFHSVWGDFKVRIKIDKDYVVAATGHLKNPQHVGHGYVPPEEVRKKLIKNKKLCWEFEADNVHDFVWAADPDYTHLMKTTDAGTILHYFFQPGERTTENWERLHTAINEAEQFMNKRYGKYPYASYAFIQGGDGGMEYPMATLITGERNYTSLVGVSIHEWMHSWYQMVLATNESLYEWMDEGFTSFGSAEVMNHLRKQGLIPGDYVDNPHENTVLGFARWATTGKDEALITHADHYTTNQAYGVAAYTKGNVFLKQLAYIIGEDAFYRGLKRYYEEWQYRHPNPNDFIRVMEKVSGIELDWYREYWVNTTHTIDYAIESVQAEDDGVIISLERKGVMPMPVDLTVRLNNGSELNYYIPLGIMRGEKSGDIFKGVKKPDWPWTHPGYTLEVSKVDLTDIQSVEIDASIRIADIDRDNNIWPREIKDEGME